MANASTTPPTEAEAAEAAPPEVAAVELPARVRLVAPYGYVDDASRAHSWLAGVVVAEPAEIALLIERGAPVQAVDG